MATLVQKRQAVIDRLNGEEKQIYNHDFVAKTGKCKKCSRKLTDCVFTDKNNVQRINMMCGVIGREEVERFRDYIG